MSNVLFGWDLLIKSVESEVKSNEDILLCFTHLLLISNGFQCIGLGDSKIIDGSETKTEALPMGWSDSYAIRYIYNGRLYNLKASKTDAGLTINLIRIDERSVSLVLLNTNSVSSRKGSLAQMIPNHEELANQIKTELINKVVTSQSIRDSASQTESSAAASSVEGPRSSLLIGGPRPGSWQATPESRVGEMDLHPFGRHPFGISNPPGGGGMLFEPPGRPAYPGRPDFGLPPGAIPPGARFDPFRPPDVDRPPRRPNNRPDNDEFLPPGYDDMFM